MEDMINKIVYFVEERGGTFNIQFGLTEIFDEYKGKYLVVLYDLKDKRTVNDIPIDEFESTPWEKYKGDIESYWDKLVIGDSRTDEERLLMHKLKYTNPDDIKTAIEQEIFVKRKPYPSARITIELSKDRKYIRFIKEIPHWVLTYGEDHRTFEMVSPEDICETYEEAKIKQAELIQDLANFRGMSDEEWSIEEIDKTLKRIHDSALRQKYRDKLMSMDNIADLEICKVGENQILYRYFKYPANPWSRLKIDG